MNDKHDITTVHEVEWTNEKVGAFWNYMSKKENNRYFAEEVGDAVLSLSAKHLSLGGEILDYGTGNGYLIKYLLNRDLTGIISGCDFSTNSVEKVNGEFAGNERFGGCQLISKLPTNFLTGHFDIVYCLETIEHLIDRQLEDTMQEIFRILKPGGYVVITTPSNENLNLQNVMCPDCGAIFHRVQHVNTFTEQSIRAIMSGYGFENVYVKSVDLYDYKNGPFLKRMLKKFVYAVLKKAKPASNLVYLGRKNGQ